MYSKSAKYWIIEVNAAEPLSLLRYEEGSTTKLILVIVLAALTPKRIKEIVWTSRESLESAAEMTVSLV